ncbi:hypothetical protein K438DRAFT_1955195 [Mycena galopus ATCC 62051]|nr:hypothetical protein K438DRAFT_1955195 [Mycena galopus ATCC 62051]
MSWFPSSRRDCHSPILSLPPEIAAHIFSLCLPAPPLNTELHSWPSPRREAPLLLAQICCQWREICLGAHELWASFAFEKGSADLLDLWLSRAGNHLLTVFLRAVEETKALMFMQVAMRYSSQWRDVHLILPLDAMPHLEKSGFPRLEQLKLRTAWAEEWNGTQPIIIRDAPLLHYANIPFLSQFDLPWEQLTTLQFGRAFDVAQVVDVLRCCTNLVNLRCFDLGENSTVSAVELRCLRSLKIGDTRSLRCLTVPRLERLEVVDDIGRSTADALQSLFLRSSCELRFLSLRVNQANAAQLQVLFRTTSSVVHLELYHVWNELQMQALHAVGILPRLQHLEIRYHYLIGHYRPLLEMLWWRQRDGTLKLFELFLGNSLSAPLADVLDEFRAMAEAGLQVRVSGDMGILLDTCSNSPSQ